MACLDSQARSRLRSPIRKRHLYLPLTHDQSLVCDVREKKICIWLILSWVTREHVIANTVYLWLILSWVKRSNKINLMQLCQQLRTMAMSVDTALIADICQSSFPSASLTSPKTWTHQDQSHAAMSTASNHGHVSWYPRSEWGCTVQFSNQVASVSLTNPALIQELGLIKIRSLFPRWPLISSAFPKTSMHRDQSLVAR